MTYRVTQYAWFNWFDPVDNTRLVEIGALVFEAEAEAGATSTHVQLNGDGYYLDVYGIDLEVDENGILSGGGATRVVKFDATTNQKIVQWDFDAIDVAGYRDDYENDVPYGLNPDAPGTIFDASAVPAQPSGAGIGVYGANGGDDTMYGSGGADELIGYSGNDQIRGNGGNDLLWADEGDDSLFGGAGNDELVGALGNDKLYGDADNDMLWGDEGNDSLYGGTGNDDLRSYTGNDKLYGESGNDALRGWDGKDSLDGGSGNDNLDGEAGNDDVKGGTGHDFLVGGTGKDTLNGGSGHDWATASLDSTKSDSFTIDLAKKTIKSAYGTDKLSSIENAYGSAGKDVINGNSGDNSLVGYTGKDTISGSGGDDKISGGLGNDKLTGGTGRDSFIFFEFGPKYADHIVDFKHGQDKIVLDHNPFAALNAGKLKASNFVLGTKAKDSNDHVIYDKKSGKLYYDEDGKGGVDKFLVATLDSKPTLSASDFKIIASTGFDDFWIV